MQLTLIEHEDYVLAKTDGPIDQSAQEPFREQLHPLVGRGGAKLILDLSGSSRITTAGIGQLVLLVTDANTNNSRVIMAAPSPMIAGVFQVSKLHLFFEIARDVADAVAMLQSDRPGTPDPA